MRPPPQWDTEQLDLHLPEDPTGPARWAGATDVFARSFALGPTTRILDLGSGDGSAIHPVLHGTSVQPRNVYVAGLSLPSVQQGFQRYGYKPILLGESEHLPFVSGFFDVVHCSCVLEQLTVPKDPVRAEGSPSGFRHDSSPQQQFFAREIRRVGRQYFVRTAHRFSAIGNRSWVRFSGRAGDDAVRPERNLVSRREMARLFPDSRILTERVLGFPTALIAVRSDDALGAGAR